MKDDEASMNSRNELTKQGDTTKTKIQPTLFDPVRVQRIEIPPDRANSNASVDAVTGVQLEPIARRGG